MQVEFAELELEAENRLEKLKRRLGREAIKLQGKRPSGLKAEMCYIIAKERGLDISQDKVAEIYGCTWVTVHKNVKLLKQLMQDDVVKLKEKGRSSFHV